MLPGVPEILWESLQGKAIWRPYGLEGACLLPAQNGRQRDRGGGCFPGWLQAWGLSWRVAQPR